ncbi:hypothetical protein ULMS_02610 [Patiriisocius marinistellae]|uniref:FeoB-associated Cys-rich membrane protein n=1 Tax=Patiriisocius marinistellae TaxID=2494560 RepID=A0A5J4FTA4_9FLAO|nr:hypothetical protein [Patiriisocius marinistellae]GEQ84753.1 hypothetical protein ULMS_02610 [Patiriisocius marinistellae]
MQTTLVIITFIIAAGYLFNKFILASFLEKKKTSVGTLDGGNTKCGKSDCGCH